MVGKKAETRVAILLHHTHTGFTFQTSFTEMGRGESHGWDTNVMHLVYWAYNGGCYCLNACLKDCSNSSKNLNLLGRVKPDNWHAKHQLGKVLDAYRQKR